MVHETRVLSRQGRSQLLFTLMLVLRTPRLVLRWFSPDDAPFVLELLNEPSWIKNIGDRGIRTVDEARAWVETSLIPNYRSQGMGFWAVEHREHHALMGMCGLIQRASLPDVDVGYAFLPRFWNHGFAKEAALACVEYGERVLGLDRVLAITSPHNIPSARVLRGIGFQHEDTRILAGEEHETDVYARGRGANTPRASNDKSDIDDLVKRFFSLFNNTDAQVAAVAALPYFFLPKALITTIKLEENALGTYSVREFMDPRSALLSDGRLVEFSEREVESYTEIHGHIAHRWTFYTKSGTLDGQPFAGQGRKSFQLVKTGSGWKIAALAWEDTPSSTSGLSDARESGLA